MTFVSDIRFKLGKNSVQKSPRRAQMAAVNKKVAASNEIPAVLVSFWVCLLALTRYFPEYQQKMQAFGLAEIPTFSYIAMNWCVHIFFV